MSLIRTQKVLCLQMSQLHHRMLSVTLTYIENAALNQIQVRNFGVQLVHGGYQRVVLQLCVGHLVKPMKMTVTKQRIAR